MRLIILILGVAGLIASAGCATNERDQNRGAYRDVRDTGFGQGYQTFPNPEFEQKYEEHQWER